MDKAIHPVRELAEDAVHIWRVPLAASSTILAGYHRLLAPEEGARAARFHFEIHRTRFVIARARLRILLASYLGCEPAGLAFTYTEHGKPYPSGSWLTFNLSHAHEMAVIGVARNRAIGVDIEHMRAELAGEEIAERYFAGAEVRALRSFLPEEQPAAFFRCWTRKEAYIKGRGEGLSMPLADFEVCLEDKEDLPLVNYKDPNEAARWKLYNIAVQEGYAAAVAVEGIDLSLDYLDWSEDLTSTQQ